jgi:GT2 family glycosyltransferase
MPHVAVNIVTYNSSVMIDACLEAVYEQDYRDYCVTVIDNQSTDDTLARLAQWQERGLRVIVNESNVYFSRAHNDAIKLSDAELVLTLNPDVIMYPDYLSRVVEAFSLSSTIGSVNGKLLSLEPREFREEILGSPPRRDAVIDGAGLMMYRSRRPYLRGSGQLNRNACLRPQRIFGADGACAAYRRSMLEDVAIDGEYFDNDFVIYREDVDLAWRAQLFGWDSYFEPRAVGYHVRRFRLGHGRRSVPEALRRHSVRNGWLLLIKNDSLPSLLRCSPAVLSYQLKIVGGLLTVEPSSLRAIPEAASLIPRMVRKRESIQVRRRRPESEMRPWFE